MKRIISQIKYIKTQLFLIKAQKIKKLQKRQNKALAKQRIAVEYVSRMMKRFLILKNTYRNKQKRFRLRVNPIAAIYSQDTQCSN